MYRERQGDEYKIRVIYLCKAFPITTASTKDARDLFMQKQKNGRSGPFLSYIYFHIPISLRLARACDI